MREIKFRAWTHGWHGKGPSSRMSYSGDANNPDIVDFFPIKDGDTLMQYTGLNDTNGKEIYEGDILGGCSDELPLYIEFSEKRGAFCFVDKFDSYGKCYYTTKDLHWEDFEVIGNIYENPDLLDIENLIK